MNERKKILLVDDSEVTAKMLSAFLDGNGYLVERAVNGVDAIQKAYQFIPDLIIMDVEMPLLRGYQTSRLLKSRRGVKDIPIIMHTNYSEDKDKFWAINSKADAFVTKNFANMNNLLELIKKSIEHPPYNIQEITDDAKSITKDSIFESLGILFDQELFQSTILNLLGNVGRSIGSLSETIESVLNIIDKVCENHISIIILYDKHPLVFVKPANTVYENDVEEFCYTCFKDCSAYFPEMNCKDVEKIVFNISNRTDYHSPALPKKFNSYTFSHIKGKGGHIIGSIHIGNLTSNYFSPFILSNIKTFSDGAGIVIENALLLAKLQELNATKDKFFSIIAHDIKNPLGIVIGYSDILSGETIKVTEEQNKTFIKGINEASKNLLKLLENLLEWARAQTGRIEFNPKTTALKNTVMANIELLSKSAEAKGIKLISEVDENILIYADHNMITTVIRNLLSNAIKFTRQGGEIKVSAKDIGNFIEVAVSDTGVGMKEEDLKKLFRLDVHHTTVGTSKEKGTGLGLILCKEFVEKNGGKIHVESVYGQGTTFKFTLPKGSPIDSKT